MLFAWIVQIDQRLAEPFNPRPVNMQASVRQEVDLENVLLREIRE